MTARCIPPLLFASAAIAVATQPSYARPLKSRPVVASPNSEASAVRTFAYSDNATYSVQTAPGRVTDIALEPGETLGAVASGDTARWVIGDTTSGAGDDLRVHVLVKPVDAGIATNLVITTNRRVYHLLLSSGGSPDAGARSGATRGSRRAKRRADLRARRSGLERVEHRENQAL